MTCILLGSPASLLEPIVIAELVRVLLRTRVYLADITRLRFVDAVHTIFTHHSLTLEGPCRLACAEIE